MAKFSGAQVQRPTAASPVRTTEDVIANHAGGRSYSRDAESDLFLLAATNMVSEDTFYESADVRDKRYRDLIREVTKSNPGFIAGDGTPEHLGLTAYLRQNLQMRSAATVLAAEYVAAGGPNGRKVVDAALQRGDEPAEILSYWTLHPGRSIPQPIKRGVADAVRRLYTERSALRYDGQGRGMRMGDVIELVHPKPKDARQSQLFEWLLDRGHKRDRIEPGADLKLIAATAHMTAIPETDRRQLLRDDPEALEQAGFSWERLSSWLPGGMDAEAWSAVIPSMGIMALVRNLRNFDQAGISESTVDLVIAKITDPQQVAKARLFPYQVWAAYANAPSDNWKRALGRTMDLTTANIPELDRTLILIDTSGSMDGVMSNRSTMRRVEVAAVMAMATAKRSTNVDVVIFGAGYADVDISGCSVLSGVASISQALGMVGHSTMGHTAIQQRFDPARHRRVVMFTDDQQQDSHLDISRVPLLYTFNLAGYAASAEQSGHAGRHTLGGFSDATFTLMEVLEAGHNARWPF